MKVFLCTINGNCAAFHRLKKRIKRVVPTGSFQIRRGSEEISQELRRSLGEYTIAVLVAKNSQDLEEYISLEHLLKNLPLILVLPDFEQDTLSKAYRLYPRFISHVESDFKNIPRVLEKMLTNMRSKHSAETS